MSIVKPEAPGAFPFFRRESLSAMWWAVMGSEYPGPEKRDGGSIFFERYFFVHVLPGSAVDLVVREVCTCVGCGFLR